ncbi:hypothetical protein SYNPS1DRAFT_26739 [Syncephalis pseudoplumigaleata]|uniref:Uncharacterized protein n=1 Tax=Syncephalis pseudoplumigaleata TaxID=1712513 RepID=A0A4P9Z6V9_9FUNG|nr:hypothetical protein SYNPS1DRAFT_26739 [Syncephalis pseudoplumigaleata]|eukprot:RKP27611.1 hypothetical protein SYNPS1DRAFT_26739 [Syncephalis pseudoplumigaleata]
MATVALNVQACVHAGWPYAKQARVVGITNAAGKYELLDGTTEASSFKKHSKHNALQWKTSLQSMRKSYRKQGIVLQSKDNILVHVKGSDGSCSAGHDVYPLELIVQRNIHGENVRSSAAGGDAALKKGHASIADNGLQPSCSYEPASAIADQLAISITLLGRLTSSIKVYDENNEDLADIGLCIQRTGGDTATSAYCRKDADGWSYSSQAADMIRAYVRQFPRLMSRLGKQLFGDRIRKDRLFPDDPHNDELIEVTAWIATASCCGRGTTRSKMVNIARLHAEATARLQLSYALPRQKPAALKFHAQAVLNTSCDALRLQLQQFAVGDRVVIIKERGQAPFGCYATVIEYNAPVVKLFLDYPFAFAQPIDLS